MTTTEQQQAVVTALTARQGAARDRVETNMLSVIARLILGMRGRWYDDKAVREFKTAVIQVVRPAQVIVGDVTGSYIDRVLSELEVSSAPGGVSLPEPLRLVDPMEQWERPAKVYRRARLLGLDELEAEQKASERAEQMAGMDLGLAAREGARQRLVVNPKVLGYRRVIHPELSKTGVCGLCIVASDRTYGKQELLPLHGGCNCTVLPVTNAHDPGQQINSDDLKAIYAAAGASRSKKDQELSSTSREDLQRVRVEVNEHGELGPILSRRGENFRDAETVERVSSSRVDPASRAAAELKVLEKSLAALEARARAGEDVSAPLTYQRKRVADLRRIAAADKAA